MKTKSYTIASVLFLASLFLAACGSANAPTLGPATPSAAVIETPEVTADLGAVVAQLYYADGGQPSRKQIFYAAPLAPVKNAEGQEVALVAGLDATKAQWDESDADGKIVISRILPGRYGLAMATPRGYILLTESTSAREILFDVVAGQVTDLGKYNILVEKSLVEP